MVKAVVVVRVGSCALCVICLLYCTARDPLRVILEMEEDLIVWWEVGCWGDFTLWSSVDLWSSVMLWGRVCSVV